jgi:nucleotide-binding universal stress UspA family protein
MTHGGGPFPVVAGIDGSNEALAAARFALDEARRRSAPLHLVTVLSWPYDGLTTAPRGSDVPALVRASGQEVTQRAVDALADASSDVEVTTSVVDGHPVTVLREASESAQLMVLGSRGVGGIAGLLLGSTATRVVSHARCPVVVLPDEAAVLVDGRRSVVVGVEGRHGDDEVLAFAFNEADGRRSDLVAVHAWEEVVLDTSLRTVNPLIDWAGVVTDEERVLAEALAGWRDKEPDVPVREVVVRDRAARALVGASMTAEMLVVGHRERRAPGSTVHGVLNRASCPVAVVPLAEEGDR